MAARRDWFASMLESSLDNDIQDPGVLLGWATPAILVDVLPSDLVAAILQGALDSGAMTAEHVVSTVGTQALAANLPDDVIWGSLSAAAEGAGLTADQPATGYSRTFLHGALQSGFDADQVSAEDVLRHASPSVLTQHLPAQQSARLLEASLAAGSMNPQLVLDTLGLDTLCDHLPANILWGVVAEQAGADSDAPAAFAPEPATEAVEIEPDAQEEEAVEIEPEELAPVDEADPDTLYPDAEPAEAEGAEDLQLDDALDLDADATADEAAEDDLDLDMDLELDDLGDDDEDDDDDNDDNDGGKKRSRIRSGKALGKSSIAAARFRSRKSK